MEELSLTLIDFLREIFWCIGKRYQIQEEGTAVQILEAIRAFQRMSEEGGGAGLCQGFSESVR